MKKNVLFMAIGAMLFASVMTACNEKNPYPGYENTSNGLYYQFFTQNEGELPQEGQLMDVFFNCIVNDTTPVIPAMQNVFRLEKSLFPGDIFEGMAMMHKGDSASFIVNIDSTFRTFFQQPTLPSEFNSTDVMRFNIRMDDFYPESEYAKRFAANVKKMADERIAAMKSEHPEETAQAAESLQQFLTKKGVVAEPTESGLVYVMTAEGNGEKPEVGQKVKVHYIGKLLDGTVFDSSVERGEPIEFPLGVGQVIPGWDEGIQLMSKGEKGVLYIPYYLAYGDRAAGEKIVPYSNLVFDVELVDFE